MTDLPRRNLGQTGLSLTEFSFGCAGIAGMYQACPPDQAAATLTAAWDAGIRYFDTAPFYGHGLSEQRLGAFLADKPRSDVVISTKAGRILTPAAPGTTPDHGFVGANPARVHFDYSHDGIMRSVEASLKRLRTDHIDILYVHDIGTFAHGPTEGPRHRTNLLGSGIKALTTLKDQGTIRAFGLGVNETAICLDLMARAPLDVILLAGRYTLLDRQAEADLLPACRTQGLPLVIGGVLNSGILATGAIPGARFNYEPASPDILARVATMDRICTTQGTTLLSAALNFPLQDPIVASVLIGASDPTSLRANMAAARQRPRARVFHDTGPASLR